MLRSCLNTKLQMIGAKAFKTIKKNELLSSKQHRQEAKAKEWIEWVQSSVEVAVKACDLKGLGLLFFFKAKRTKTMLSFSDMYQTIGMEFQMSLGWRRRWSFECSIVPQFFRKKLQQLWKISQQTLLQPFIFVPTHSKMFQIECNLALRCTYIGPKKKRKGQNVKRCMKAWQS